MKINNDWAHVRLLQDENFKLYVYKHLTFGLPVQQLALQHREETLHIKHDDTFTNMQQSIATMFLQDAGQHYFITSTVATKAAAINIDKVDLRWFDKLDMQAGVFVLSKTKLFKYFVLPDFGVQFIYIDTENPYLTQQITQMQIHEGKLYALTSEQNLCRQFLQLLLFIELSEIEYLHLDAQKKIHSNLVPAGKIKNETTVPIKMVTSLWNIDLTVGPFGVRGHLRIQPCGVGRKNYKLVYISEYTKSGYHRKAKA